MPTSRFRRAFCLAGLLTSTLLGGTAAAADYPSRPVTLVVPFPPGGPTDVVGRLIAKGLSEQLGQAVLVENRPGAGGTIGAASVAQANADGHTLLYGSTSTLAISPAIYPNLSYRPDSFTPVALVMRSVQILVANPRLPVSSLAELIQYTRANPGKVNYSSAGNGTPGHLATELLKSQTGIEAAHIPYKGGSPALTAALAGEVDFTLDVVPTSLPHVQGGRLKALGIPSRARSPQLPGVPTMAEAGFDIEADIWSGVVGPAAMPEAVTQRLNQAVRRVVTSPAFREQLAALGAEAQDTTPEQFGEYIRAESRKWAEVAKSARVSLD